jgi:hypothetical protein
MLSIVLQLEVVANVIVIFRNHLSNKTLFVEIDVGTALCKFGSQVLQLTA